MTSPRAGDAGATIRELRLGRKPRRTSTKRGARNPLRAGLRVERVPDPNVVVLFGATGDLARRKVVPAIFQLWVGGLLPERFALVCFGRRDLDDATIRADLRAALDRHARIKPVDEAAWSAFAERISYVKGEFDDAASYTSLAQRLDEIDRAAETGGNRLFYLATPSSSFPEIVRGLGGAGLDHEKIGRAHV